MSGAGVAARPSVKHLVGPMFPRGPARGRAFPLRSLSLCVYGAPGDLLESSVVTHLVTEAMAARQARPTDNRAHVAR